MVDECVAEKGRYPCDLKHTPACTAEGELEAATLMQWSERVNILMQKAGKGVDEDYQIVASLL